MIIYKISYNNPHRHYIDFELTTKVHKERKIQLQLSAWRPGRYELGNFSQNIQKLEVYDENNNSLSFKKITKDLWEINCSGVDEIIVRYNFYANQLDAGGCYLDENQLYLNPIHCMFYIVGRMEDEYKLNFDLPDNYVIASSLTTNKHTLLVKGYDLLADSPIICSDSLQHDYYEVNGINFHLWFQGNCKPDWNKLKNDFKKFTNTQINCFGSFPSDEFHFFFQVTPYKSYHGVEHLKNTVLLIGPGDEIMTKRYEDLLGVCSHELYHVWNVKTIRPIEMFPYDYTQENYFKTGYVAEGVTTYMGDLLLYSSGVFSWDEFAKTQNQNLERHLMNYGRFNLSGADSGFDSWLDGYKLGAPDRKTSIYPDAALCMLMIDLEIIKNTNGKESLHSVMKELFHNYALKEKGYSEDEFISICTRFGGETVKKIFQDHIYGTKDYIPQLRSALDIVGIELVEKRNPNITAQYFGFITIQQNGKFIIKKVEPNSEIDQSGIAPEDELVKINGVEISGDLSELLSDCSEEVSFTFRKKFFSKDVILKIGNYYPLLEINKKDNASKEQLTLRKIWCNN